MGHDKGVVLCNLFGLKRSIFLYKNVFFAFSRELAVYKRCNLFSSLFICVTGNPNLEELVVPKLMYCIVKDTNAPQEL